MAEFMVFVNIKNQVITKASDFYPYGWNPPFFKYPEDIKIFETLTMRLLRSQVSDFGQFVTFITER